MGVSENPGPLTRHSDASNTSKGVPQYELRDGAWLDDQNFPPLAYNVPGLMPAGFGLIAGPPKLGKSLLVLDWLLGSAIGGSALGTVGVGAARDVLYFALEDGDRRLQARCRLLLDDGYPIPGRFRYITVVPPGELLAVLDHALGRYPDTRVVVIDTLAKIMPVPFQGETTYQRDYRVAVALKRRADERPGLTIVANHHTRKAFADDFIDSVSGTHGLAGAADTIIVVARPRGQENGTLRVTGRDVTEADYAVRFRYPFWQLDGADLGEARANQRRRTEVGALGGRSAEIIEFTRQHRGGVRAGQVREKFGADADMYLKRLLASGRLARPKRGLYVLASEPSEVSETQVSGGAETNTGLWEVSETGQDEQPPPPGSIGQQASQQPPTEGDTS
jgi:hypothetical protein